MQFITLYAISVPIFFLIDMIWLGLVARPFYQKHLAGLLGEVQWVPAIIFYFIFLLGLTFFATAPAVQGESWKTAVLLGALFGFFTYATYDLTNLATLRDWPLLVSVVDIIWGTVLGALVSFVVYTIYNYLIV